MSAPGGDPQLMELLRTGADAAAEHELELLRQLIEAERNRRIKLQRIIVLLEELLAE